MAKFDSLESATGAKTNPDTWMSGGRSQKAEKAWKDRQAGAHSKSNHCTETPLGIDFMSIVRGVGSESVFRRTINEPEECDRGLAQQCTLVLRE
jgi:hypothetical protein